MKLREALKADFIEFCCTAGIHGLRYLVDDQKSSFSRVLWLLVVVVSFVLSGICVRESVMGKTQSRFKIKD